MLTRHLIDKILDIRLEEEKYYFPGETIKGLVIVHPKSAIKVNAIQLKFYGQVYIHLKEKETTTLFENTLTLSVYPHSVTPKQTTLDASEHVFHFEFIVPDNLDLPSSMEFGKKTHIRYKIHAVLDRPMIPESLCPKTDYTVLLLEYIDIEKAQFKIPQEKSLDVILPKAKYNQKCMVRASMPRLGFTRGDIVPLKVTVDHFTSFSRKQGVTVDLVRTVEIRTTRHTIFKEAVLKSSQYDIDITEQALQQSIMCQLLIPTSTPPSIRYKDTVLRFHYKVKTSVTFNKKCICTLDMPIVLGTWPLASIPIEDDEPLLDNELPSEDDIESLRTCSVDDMSSIKTGSNILPSWHTNNSSSTLPHSSILSNDMVVGRSDSVASKASNNSISSWKSSQSYEQQYYQHQPYSHSSNNLSRNISQSTTVSSPDRLPSYYTTNPNNLTMTPTANTHHRSASTVYSSTEYPPYNANRNGNGSAHHYHPQPFYHNPARQSMVSLPPLPQNNPNRLSRYSTRTEEDYMQPPIILEHDNVPTHILEPLPSSNDQPSPPRQEEPSISESSSFEDSDDEGDLLAIIERKQKRALRKKKQQQQQHL